MLAKPRGFCAGVRRAIEIVDESINNFSGPIYVKHEIVHNVRIVKRFESLGVIFIDDLSEVPNGSTVIFSAHGSPEKHYSEAHEKNLLLIDATCPLVSKVHKVAKQQELAGKEIIIIGHRNHIEIIGTSGNIKQNAQIVESVKCVDELVVKNPDNLAFVTQTTLSVDDTRDIIVALKQRFPAIYGGENGIGNTCYATQNRQDAVKKIIQDGANILLVIGSKNSSNSTRLKEIGDTYGIKSFLIDGKDDLSLSDFDDSDVVGITAGASAHESFVEEVIGHLRSRFEIELEETDGEDEDVVFFPPKIIRDLKKKNNPNYDN